MNKTRTTVKVAGKEYTISSYDTAEYVERVATYVDRKMSEFGASTNLPSAQLAVLVCMNVTDDMLKAHDEVARLRKELSAAKDELDSLRVKLNQ